MTTVHEVPVVVVEATPITAKQQKYLTNFKRKYKGIARSIIDTAKAYADAVKADPAMRDIFRKEYPGIKNLFWSKLEKVATDTMDSRLFEYTGSHANRLIEMPKSDQTKMIDEGIQVADEASDGSIKFRKLRLKDMTPEQVGRAITTHGIKSTELQQTELQKQITRRNIKANAAAVASSSAVQRAVKTDPYTEGQKGVQFHGSCHVSWTKLRNMVRKHDKKAQSK